MAFGWVVSKFSDKRRVKLIAFEGQGLAFAAAGRLTRVRPHPLAREFEGRDGSGFVARPLKRAHALRVHFRDRSGVPKVLNVPLNLLFNCLKPIGSFHVPRVSPPVRSMTFRRFFFWRRHNHFSDGWIGTATLAAGDGAVIPELEKLLHVADAWTDRCFKRKPKRDLSFRPFDFEVNFESDLIEGLSAQDAAFTRTQSDAGFVGEVAEDRHLVIDSKVINCRGHSERGSLRR